MGTNGVFQLKYQTIKKCGALGVEFGEIHGEGSKVSREFLRKLFNSIIRRSTNYYDQTKEHVFVYRERQLHSVVCPSISDITSSFLMECPLKRKPSGEHEYSGSVDYWISYRNYTILMELKHSFFAYRNASNPSRSISRKFNYARRQLSDIRLDECRDLIWNNKGLMKIALQTIAFYKGSKRTDLKDELNIRDFKDLFKRLLENSGLKDVTNVRSLWLLNERLIESVQYDSRYEIYPAVAFVGNISELIS